MSTKSKGQDLLTEHDSGFYEIEGKLYYMKNNGDMFEVNLDKETTNDNNNNNQHSIKNYIDKKRNMKDDTKKASQDLSEDLTNQQNEENYWKQTSQTKIDGSVMAM